MDSSASPARRPALAAAIGTDRKGFMSPVLYAIAIPTALVAPFVALAMCIVVVALWIVPDLRVERALAA